MFAGYLPISQVQVGGTHRFHNSAAVEAKHRESLKSNGKKVRIRTDTETEQDLLRVTQEELVFDTVQTLLDDTSEKNPPPMAHDDVIALFTRRFCCRGVRLWTCVFTVSCLLDHMYSILKQRGR